MRESAMNAVRGILARIAGGTGVRKKQKKSLLKAKPPENITSEAMTDAWTIKASSVPVIPFVSASAIAETVVFLGAAVLLNIVFGDGTRFITMPLHPFWIVVLLVTVQYGPVEALAAALLSSAALLIGNLPEQSMAETMYEYILRVSLTPFLWIVVALVLGSVRARQVHERKDLLNQMWKSEQAAAAIVENYKAAKLSKERLELRLAEERCSVLTMYDIAKSLETLDPEEAAAGVERLIRTSLNPKKFSLFRAKDSALSLKAAYGWDKAAPFESRFGGHTGLAQSIIEDKAVLSIVREDDEAVLDGQGMLAGPVINEETGEVMGMLKIEESDFMDLGIRTHEIFRIVCAWIARVYVNVDKFQAAQKELPSALAGSGKRRITVAGKTDSDYPGKKSSGVA